MTDEKRSRRARRKAHEKLLGEAAAATRTWQLFGEAMRFAHAHAPEGADVFNLLNTSNLSGYSNNATQSNQIQVGGRERGIVQKNAGVPRQFQFGARWLF